MAYIHNIGRLSLAISTILIFLAPQLIKGQIPSLPCSPSTIMAFTPCLSFITNSTTTSNNTSSSSPSSNCCNVLKSVTSNGTSCLCFIASGAPFQVPINRNLTLSLPRACQMPAVPIQCKASGAPGAPSPASSPVSEAPTLAPGPSRGPTGDAIPKSNTPGEAPKSDANPSDQTPPSPTANSGTPGAKNSSNQRPPAPSAAPFLSISPLLLLAAFGAVALKLY